MPGETTNLKIPYPLDTESPDGAGQMKALAEKLDAKLPQALVRKTTEGDTPIGHASNTYLTFPTEVEDVALGGGAGAMHSTVSNTGRLTCVTPGLYLFYTHLYFIGVAGGDKVAVWFRKTKNAGGTDIIGRQMQSFGDESTKPSITTSYAIRMLASDYVEVGTWIFTSPTDGGFIDLEDATFGFGQEFGAVMLSP